MRILFMASSRKGKGLSPFIQSQKESIENHGVVIDLFLISGEGLMNYLKAIRLLRNKCKVVNYDIIHAHYGFCGVIAKLAFTKKPLIVSFLGDDLMGNVKMNGKYSITGKFFTFINKAFARYFFTLAIVKSSSLKKQLPYGTPCIIIPNGIDFSKFYPISPKEAREKLHLTLTEKVILFPSYPERSVKNYELFNNAIKLLKEKENYLILKLENVIPDAVYLYYNAVNVTVLTSFHEGSPNVIKEAMACNCPIVSVDVGDVKEVISITEGCFVCSYNPEDVAEKIMQAIRFGRRTNGREMIGHLESGVIADRIVKVYEDILKK
jgi:teichuronic acid biosynthesis glycosyltransferase TuaC